MLLVPDITAAAGAEFNKKTYLRAALWRHRGADRGSFHRFPCPLGWRYLIKLSSPHPVRLP